MRVGGGKTVLSKVTGRVSNSGRGATGDGTVVESEP